MYEFGHSIRNTILQIIDTHFKSTTPVTNAECSLINRRCIKHCSSTTTFPFRFLLVGRSYFHGTIHTHATIFKTIHQSAHGGRKRRKKSRKLDARALFAFHLTVAARRFTSFIIRICCVRTPPPMYTVYIHCMLNVHKHAIKYPFRERRIVTLAAT